MVDVEELVLDMVRVFENKNLTEASVNSAPKEPRKPIE